MARPWSLMGKLYLAVRTLDRIHIRHHLSINGPGTVVLVSHLF
jgi:hypothetical protein